ncbi:MAG: hypothetical protein WAL64_00730 [Candidatus Dormiibacterota bacterium]
MTFVSAQDGWVLGTAPCGASTCLAILRTQDGGHTWSSVPAPPTTYSTGPTSPGVNGIRFADTMDGWVFGPQLWATHNGGVTWSQIAIRGWSTAEFEDLETAAGTVHAAFFDFSDAEPDDAMIATSPVGSNAWQVSATSFSLGAGPVPEPEIVLQGGVGWILENDRTVVGGAKLIGNQWESWQPPCIGVNGPASLAASSAQNLVAVCNQGVWGPATPSGGRVWVSHNGGVSFRLLSTALPGVDYGPSAGPLASPSASVAVVGETNTILATFNGGASWSNVYAAAGGIAYLGFTTTSQGVAIEGSAGPLGSLLMTFDGGHKWEAVAL